MGSLIQTLAEQAKSSIPEGTLSVSEWIESYNKKFAELIVKECVTVILAAKPGVVQVPAEVALDMTAKNIKAYFGGEE